MYTCEDSDLSGGVQTISAFDAKEMIEAQRARGTKGGAGAKTNRGQREKTFAAGGGTPLGRAFKKMLT